MFLVLYRWFLLVIYCMYSSACFNPSLLIYPFSSFLLMCVSHSVVSDSLQPHGVWPTSLLHPWDFPGKSTGVGGHCLLQNEMTKTLQNMLLTPPLLLLFSCSVVSDSFCDPKDCSPPGSAVHRISQARVLEWVAISFSKGSCRLRD